MKKLFLLLLSVLVVLIALFLEGGTLRKMIAPTVIFPMLFGTFFSTLFTFNFSEIIATFKDAFSEQQPNRTSKDYHTSLLVVKNLQASIMFWSFTILVMAFFLILSNFTIPERLGPSVALAFLALFNGFGLRASVFTPMEFSLKKKIYQEQQDQATFISDN